MNASKPTMPFLPWLFTLGGAIGLVASLVISLDKLKLLQNPHYVPSCNINPIISCGSVMKTAQASVFGFPNSWLGLIGFAAVILTGISLLAGVRLRPWYWRLFNLGALLGVLLITWLFVQSVYVIHALCPWCMVVWSVTIPIFLFTTIYTLREGHLPTPKLLQRPAQVIYEYKYVVLVCWYLLIALLILHHFWYYFRTFV